MHTSDYDDYSAVARSIAHSDTAHTRLRLRWRRVLLFSMIAFTLAAWYFGIRWLMEVWGGDFMTGVDRRFWGKAMAVYVGGLFGARAVLKWWLR